MTPLRGWAARGKRLIGKAPFGHWNAMTFIAALRHDAITAPWVIYGPINGSIFRTYFEEVLVPNLRPGDIVILDNFGSHKAPAIEIPSRRRARDCSSSLPTRPTLASLKTVHRTVFFTLLTHRTGVRQAQTSPAQGRRAQQRSRLAQDRFPSRPIQPEGMWKSPQKLGIWFRVSPSCSSGAGLGVTRATGSWPSVRGRRTPFSSGCSCHFQAPNCVEAVLSWMPRATARATTSLRAAGLPGRERLRVISHTCAEIVPAPGRIHSIPGTT